jgi:group I intron endonuclease
MSKLYGKGEIYKLTAPNGKEYIGQVVCYYKTKDRKYSKACSEKRFNDHIRNSKTDNNTLLARSLRKYGAHNFKIRTILICNLNQLNYYEIKYIRQYNTLMPNGLNMVKGGGVHSGIGNPMFGRVHSEETRQKIRETQLGKILPQSQKENMSKTHSDNMKNGKLPPRRKHELPKYIYHVISKNKEGYEIRNHPTLKQKQFTSKTITLDENLDRAEKYLEDINNATNKKVLKEIVKHDDLPRYIRQVLSEKFEGFEVKYHPSLVNKKWTRMSLTMDEKLQLAKNYLNGEGSETKR